MIGLKEIQVAIGDNTMLPALFFSYDSFFIVFLFASPRRLGSAPKLNKASFTYCINCSCFIVCNLSWGLNFVLLSAMSRFLDGARQAFCFRKNKHVFFNLCCFKHWVRREADSRMCLKSLSKSQ